MCLFAAAHLQSPRFPLLIAANREEDHDRPTRPAGFWPEDPRVVGGRDELSGGTWLAVRDDGRFAAVTNLRGQRPGRRSRGELVRDFLAGGNEPLRYAREVEKRAQEYGGFHFVAGQLGAEVAIVSGSVTALSAGIVALTNAKPGEVWPKAGLAVEALGRAARSNQSAQSISDELMSFLTTPPRHDDPTRDIFIRGDQYGTRCSTVIVASAEELLLTELSFARSGLPLASPRSFRIPIRPS